MNKKTFFSFLFIGLLGLIVFISFRHLAFPEANIALTVSPSDVEAKAGQYLESRGINTEGFRVSTVFSYDDLSSRFLQKIIGNEAFNERIQDAELAPYGYDSRFFKPLQNEEYVVSVNVDGSIHGFYDLIADATAGANLGKEEARHIAEEFSLKSFNVDLSQYDEVNYQENKLDNRTDHYFTYQLKGSEIQWVSAKNPEEQGEGSRRLDVSVQGDKVGSFSSYTYVPESFAREEATSDEFGNLLFNLAYFLLVAFFIYGLFLLLKKYKASDIRSRFVFWVCIGLSAITLVATLTSLDNLYASYSTISPWTNFLTTTYIGILVSTITSFLGVFLIGLIGEGLTRSEFPEANDLDPQKSYSTAYVWQSTFKGFTSGLFILAYITVFYIIGSKYFGVWSPLQVNIVDSPNFLIFLAPIAVSLGAAIMEEFFFRYYGVSLFKKYLKNTFVALLIPAILWAFLHSTYAVYPMYMRGIELTIGGLMLGYLFIRHGLLAAIVAHYTIDIILFSLPLLVSSTLYLRWSGIADVASIFLLPVLYSAYWWNRKRKGTEGVEVRG